MRFVLFLPSLIAAVRLQVESAYLPYSVTNAIYGVPSSEELFSAILQRDADEVAGLIARGADVNLFSESEDASPLMLCALSGLDDVSAVLLSSKDIDVNAHDSRMRTAIFLALQNNHQIVAKQIIDYAERNNIVLDVFGIDASGRNLLQIAVYNNDMFAVEFLLGQGLDANHNDDELNTAVTLASHLGFTDILDAILSSERVNLNIALVKCLERIQAIQNNPTEVQAVQKLCQHVISRGANPTHALFYAVQKSTYQVLQRLTEFHPDLKVRPNGKSLLMIAANSGNISTCKYLLDNKIDIIYNLKGVDAMHCAISSSHIAIVDLLLKSGEFDPTAALSSAINLNQGEYDTISNQIIQLILSYGPNFINTDFHKQNSIITGAREVYQAVNAGDLNELRACFYSRGYDGLENAFASNGDSALSHAALSDKDDMLRFLLDHMLDGKLREAFHQVVFSQGGMWMHNFDLRHKLHPKEDICFRKFFDPKSVFIPIFEWRDPSGKSLFEISYEEGNRPFCAFLIKHAITAHYDFLSHFVAKLPLLQYLANHRDFAFIKFIQDLQDPFAALLAKYQLKNTRQDMKQLLKWGHVDKAKSAGKRPLSTEEFEMVKERYSSLSVQAS